MNIASFILGILSTLLVLSVWGAVIHRPELSIAEGRQCQRMLVHRDDRVVPACYVL